MTDPKTQAVVKAAEEMERHDGGGFTGPAVKVRPGDYDALMSAIRAVHSPLPSKREMVDLPGGLEELYAHALRLALKRFGHQEGCGDGCAACDVSAWAIEMESR